MFADSISSAMCYTSIYLSYYNNLVTTLVLYMPLNCFIYPALIIVIFFFLVAFKMSHSALTWLISCFSYRDHVLMQCSGVTGQKVMGEGGGGGGG